MTAIFWAEGDDDASRLLNAPHIARVAYAAYLLMNKSIVIHPAYTWQDSETHELLFPSAKLLRPNNTKLVLGNSPSVTEYIEERRHKLEGQESSGSMITELQQYRKFEHTIEDDSAALDEEFVQGQLIQPLSWSRDGKFRELIREDIQNDRAFGTHLCAVLHQGCLLADRDSCKKTIEEMTQDPNQLVSVDSVIKVARTHGFRHQSTHLLEARLHVLHWMAHDGPGMSVPLLYRIDHRLHPDDPSVFWNAINGLFGSTLYNGVVSRPWSEVIAWIETLRHDVLWKQFLETYEEIVDLVEQDQGAICNQDVLHRLQEKYPPLIRLLSQSPISKLGWLSVICTIVGLSAGMGVIAWGGTIGTLGDAFFAMLKQYGNDATIGRLAIQARVKSLLS